MKKNILHTLRHGLCLLLLPLLLHGCLYEEPQLTTDGQLGIDPTAVTVAANLSLNLKLPEATKPTTRAEEPTYRHRFIIEAYLNREVAARQVVYEEVTNRTQLTIPVSLKLHARNYQLVVWADYITESSEADLYYDTQEKLMTIYGTEPYRGNSEWKDAATASQPLDLSDYRNQWNANVPLTLQLQRPMARYELIATDVATFLRRIAKGEVTGKKFTARVKYDYYLPVGYNAFDGLPKHALMYMQYTRTFTVPAEGEKEFSLAFDYLLVGAEPQKVPITLEIVNEKSVTIARTSLHIPCHINQRTTMRSAFLTADPNGGIGMNPDYDGSIDVDFGDL